MELNWSTFLLEILNFLVLVWILKHFLYRPVLDVINRRRAAIDQTLAEATQQRTDAETLRQQYENRMAEWNQTQRQEHDRFEHELEQERERRLAELKTALQQERERAQVTEERRLSDTRTRLEQTALEQAADFASRLLTESAGPELEARLIELLLAELGDLPEERIKELRNGYGKNPDPITVTSAHPLAEPERQRLTAALNVLTDTEVRPEFRQDPDLIAGLRITIGAWVLDANLQAELRGFAEFAHALPQN